MRTAEQSSESSHISLRTRIPNSVSVSDVLFVLQPCKLPAADSDGRKLLCAMPVVILPEVLREQLEKSESGTINGRDGPGVAVYRAAGGHARVDIYVGLELDGFDYYSNISSVSPGIKMQFAVKPTIQCQSGVITFTPGYDTTIAIQVVDSYRLSIGPAADDDDGCDSSSSGIEEELVPV